MIYKLVLLFTLIMNINMTMAQSAPVVVAVGEAELETIQLAILAPILKKK